MAKFFLVWCLCQNYGISLASMHMQMPWPHSPTEKLLEEMFTGLFAAVLKTPLDHKSCPLTHSSPRPVTGLDDNTVKDVYEELLCAGTDLVLMRLNQWEGQLTPPSYCT